MVAQADITRPRFGGAGLVAGRGGLVLGALALVAALALFAGARYGLLLLIGLGFGMVLEGLRFGFAGPWRAMILRRDPAGLLAQLLAIGLVALVAFPLLSASEGDLVGAHAPVGVAMIGGAFVFGICMQLVLGCGSGTLVNAGTGNAVSALALPFFALGSFAGAWHIDWWIGLGSAPIVALSGNTGLAITLAGLVLVAAVALALGAPGSRGGAAPAGICRRCGGGAGAGEPCGRGAALGRGLRPWALGRQGGVGVWGGSVGLCLWAAEGNAERVRESLLTDVTSLTNLGILAGAFLIAAWRRGLGARVAPLPMRGWITAVVAGLLLGYSSRLAFGCNVGAFFSGVSTGSLHGWVWFIAAFAGSWFGVRWRPALGLESKA